MHDLSNGKYPDRSYCAGYYSQGDAYGYAISQQVKRVSDVKESTLYPVLRRLQQNGYLGTYDQPFQGRNRKYYFITEDGKRQYQYYLEEWKKYRVEVEEIMMGGMEDE